MTEPTETPAIDAALTAGAGGSVGALTDAWLTVPDVAERWGTDVTRIRQAIRDRQVLAVRLEGVLRIPAVFVAETGPAKGLPGVLTLLGDAGFSDDEALSWLLTPDPTIPGSPAQALAENRGTEVKRRAQALGF
ncbi:MAG TPA: Rv2175c family DNA-binding protein [Candidatus Limnocylindria bacterium]|nr:Rv2175c family DNA-binding protein [Candidatus Limnocylindria bacterium]